MCVEVTLKTPRNVYAISSDRPLADSGSSLADGLFGGISWPISCFRIGERLLLEQQMFLPCDESTVAMSWALHGDTAIAAQLTVRPFFSGCGPRSHRDVGFRRDSEDNGERLTWLPNVRGPRLFADTNGQYHDEVIRSFDCFRDEARSSGSAEDVIAPGRFEFELSRRPGVLILSAEDQATTRHHQHVGVFLAGLMQENISGRASSTLTDIRATERQQSAIA